MIDKQLVENIVVEKLAGTDCFLVDVSVSSDNVIVVEIDNETGVDINFCVELSRYIESQLDRDVEDFELEVGSAGLTAPFKVQGQYRKNLGHEVALLTKDGRKLSGVLSAVADETFAVDITTMVKPEGAKRKIPQTETLNFAYTDVKQVCAVIKV
ncbi:MAG: ribosome assembly cofactor RimP [Paludibacteraceae bacterium]